MDHVVEAARDINRTAGEKHAEKARRKDRPEIASNRNPSSADLGEARRKPCGDDAPAKERQRERRNRIGKPRAQDLVQEACAVATRMKPASAIAPCQPSADRTAPTAAGSSPSDPPCSHGETEYPTRAATAGAQKMDLIQLNQIVDGDGDPGMTRTCDLRFRKPSLYRLSYGTRTYMISGMRFHIRAGG